ncbi:MAG: flavin reductase family protein [Sphingorhabdus sp.]
MPDELLNSDEYRAALGSFATGVTIVTTLQEPGMPVGVTASSFSSVSLNPPLVLWSLAKKSRSLAAFSDSGHFAVHILSYLQEELSNSFAQSGNDKFGGVDWRDGRLGSPVFEEFAAKFECRTVHQYEGGDHIIFVGEVIDFERRDHAPLVYHGGGYTETRPRISPEQLSADQQARELFTAILSELKPHEEDLLGHFAAEEINVAKNVLRKLTQLTAEDDRKARNG